MCQLNPLGDQDRISPYTISTISSNENDEKYQLGDYWLIQIQILQTNIKELYGRSKESC